jgi:OOP family OmpA-OmpF porin
MFLLTKSRTMKASNKLAALIALACATMVNAHAAPQEAASQQPNRLT